MSLPSAVCVFSKGKCKGFRWSYDLSPVIVSFSLCLHGCSGSGALAPSSSLLRLGYDEVGDGDGDGY